MSAERAVEAARILSGECCGTCAHAGHLLHAGSPKPATVVSCEVPRNLWRLGQGSWHGYWNDRTHWCESYARRST